jgi:hypothetical protein
MYDLKKADEIYKKRLEENPEYAKELVDEWREDMPYQFARKMYEDEYGCHIFDDEMYDKAVHLFKWVENRGTGPKWSIEEIVKLSGINFESKEYTKYDFCYSVNMFWSDFCNVFVEPNYYFKMAKNYLEDPDYCGDASERAYKDAKRRIKYFQDYED